jgi:O-antigen ligase
MLSLLIGIAFFLAKGGNIKTKIALGLIVVLGVGVLAGLSLQTDMAKRFETTVNEGNTSGRDLIYIEAAGMVNEKPLMGWGPLHYRYELGNRVGQYGGQRDAHNLYLTLLLEVGIFGAIPFLSGLGLCFWAAWKSRYGLEGSLPISMLVTVLMINMSITWDGRKIFWIILAYTLVSARYANRDLEFDSFSGQRYGLGYNKSSNKSGSPIVVGKINR